MTPVVRRVSFLLLPAVVACLAGSASSQALERDSLTCPMHPQIQVPKLRSCPICGMDLVRAVREEKPVKIAEGKLREFCAAYVEDTLKRLEAPGNVSSYLTVRAWASLQELQELQGEDVKVRLSSLLANSNLECVGNAAEELRRRGDREALPALEREFAKERLRLEFSYLCEQHPEKSHSRLGDCPICKRQMRFSINGSLLGAHLSVAGAIHSMGGDEGFQALREMLAGPFIAYAYGMLAQRDTPEVRKLLAAGARDAREYVRACAIAGQLCLGILDNLDAALEMLHDARPSTLEAILGGLRKVKSPPAREALKKLVKRKDLSRWRRLTAAVILAEQGDSHYVDFILDALTRASKEADPSAEIWALGEVGRRKHLFMLQRIIEQDPGHRADAVAAVLRILTRTGRKK